MKVVILMAILVVMSVLVIGLVVKYNDDYKTGLDHGETIAEAGVEAKIAQSYNKGWTDRGKGECPKCPETPSLTYYLTPGSYMANIAIDAILEKRITCRWVIDDCQNCKHPTEDWAYIYEPVTIGAGVRINSIVFDGRDLPICKMKWICGPEE